MKKITIVLGVVMAAIGLVVLMFSVVNASPAIEFTETACKPGSLVAYTLTVHTVGSGTVTKDPDQPTYEAGSIVTLTATASASSTFTGWTGAVTSTVSPVTVTLDSDKLVTATFTLKRYDLRVGVAGDGSGMVTPTVGVHTYDYGTLVRLTATASASSTFTGWTGAVTSTVSPVTVTLTSNKVVTGTFQGMRKPIIGTSPSVLEVMLYVGETASRTLTINNTGDLTLTWSLAELAATAWIAESPTNGLVRAASSVNVGVTFNAVGAPVGVHTATLRITSNASNAPQLDVPVSFTVRLHSLYLPAVLFDWPPRWTQGGVAGQTVYQVSVCSADLARLYAGTGVNGVYRSNNAGQTWSPTALNSGLVRGVTVNPYKCDEAYATVWGQGVHKTVNGGSDWSAAGALPEPYVYAVAVDPRPVYSQTLYVGLASKGVYSSANGGAGWMATALTDAIVPGLTAAADGSVYVATWGKGVYLLQNGSASHLGNLAGSAANVFIVAVAPTSPDILYAATDGGLYRSSDGGSHWGAGPVLSGRVFSVIVDPSNTQLVYAGVENGGVWRSEDGGTSFSVLAEGMPAGLTVRSVAIGPITSRYIHAGTTDGAWRYPR